MPLSAMIKLIRRYRAHLLSKATGLDRGAGRLQCFPWTALWGLEALICWEFGLSGPRSLYVLLPLVGLSLVGVGFVGWVFFVEGLRTDLPKRRGK
jgi:hypothetical protein